MTSLIFTIFLTSSLCISNSATYHAWRRIGTSYEADLVKLIHEVDFLTHESAFQSGPFKAKSKRVLILPLDARCSGQVGRSRNEGCI